MNIIFFKKNTKQKRKPSPFGAIIPKKDQKVQKHILCNVVSFLTIPSKISLERVCKRFQQLILKEARVYCAFTFYEFYGLKKKYQENNQFSFIAEKVLIFFERIKFTEFYFLERIDYCVHFNLFKKILFISFLNIEDRKKFLLYRNQRKEGEFKIKFSQNENKCDAKGIKNFPFLRRLGEKRIFPNSKKDADKFRFIDDKVGREFNFFEQGKEHPTRFFSINFKPQDKFSSSIIPGLDFGQNNHLITSLDLRFSQCTVTLSLIRSFPNLHTLIVNKFQRARKKEDFSSFSKLKILEILSNLEELKFLQLLDQLKDLKLKLFSFEYTENKIEDRIEELYKKFRENRKEIQLFKSLSHLKLKCSTDTSSTSISRIFTVLKYFQNLKVLDFFNQRHIVQTKVCNQALHSHFLMTLPSLQLEELYIKVGFVTVEIELIRNILERYKKLRKFDLKYTSQMITDEAVFTSLSSIAIPTQEELDVIKKKYPNIKIAIRRILPNYYNHFPQENERIINFSYSKYGKFVFDWFNDNSLLKNYKFNSFVSIKIYLHSKLTPVIINAPMLRDLELEFKFSVKRKIKLFLDVPNLYQFKAQFPQDTENRRVDIKLKSKNLKMFKIKEFYGDMNLDCEGLETIIFSKNASHYDCSKNQFSLNSKKKVSLLCNLEDLEDIMKYIEKAKIADRIGEVNMKCLDGVVNLRIIRELHKLTFLRTLILHLSQQTRFNLTEISSNQIESINKEEINNIREIERLKHLLPIKKLVFLGQFSGKLPKDIAKFSPFVNKLEIFILPKQHFMLEYWQCLKSIKLEGGITGSEFKEIIDSNPFLRGLTISLKGHSAIFSLGKLKKLKILKSNYRSKACFMNNSYKSLERLEVYCNVEFMQSKKKVVSNLKSIILHQSNMGIIASFFSVIPSLRTIGTSTININTMETVMFDSCTWNCFVYKSKHENIYTLYKKYNFQNSADEKK